MRSMTIVLLVGAYFLSSVAQRKSAIQSDIVIGGGSLAALAAALTAANVSKALGSDVKIILLEPTDWPGGQLTSSNVPPDFGQQNSVVENLPQAFVDMLINVAGPTWQTNPGKCWVSYKCFEAQLAAGYIADWLQQFSPQLEVHYNTVLKSAQQIDGKISHITAIKRTLKDPSATGYENNLSVDLLDWYSFEDSAQFSKEVLTFTDFSVIIEGTEFSDVFMTSLNPSSVSQGVETPDETSDTTDALCGQSTVLPLYMAYGTQKNGKDTVPAGSDCGQPFSLDGLTWNQVWTYRRALGLGDYTNAFVGEQSNQNLDNDYPLGYILTSPNITTQPDSAEWFGGIDLSTLQAAEQRSYGWYHYLVGTANSTVQPYLALNTTQVGTVHGLSKLPYLRDTRRSKYGLDKFRLLYADLNYSNPDDGGLTARHFNDTIGIGVYHYADIHTLHSSPTACPNGYPAYITCCEHPVKPYYVPYRALTVDGVSNLLIAGKGMSQSFLANAATRLHPTEWSSGTGAGAAAALMAINGWNSTRDVLDNIAELQSVLTGPSVRSPLTWTL